MGLGLLMLLVIFPAKKSRGQDIYDYKHSLVYGKFLINTRQFNLATEEFERLIFMNPFNDTIKQQLVHAYLMGQQYQTLILRTNTLYTNPVEFPQSVALDYSRAMVMNETPFRLEDFLKQNHNLLQDEKLFLKLNSQLLSYQWDEAEETYDSLVSGGNASHLKYDALFRGIHDAKFKKAGIALGMSAIMPGSGKAYTGEWKDGLVALFFVAGSAIQAYRGYNLYGKKSTFFIAYTGLAASFYLGNLYGSFKSARKHNDKIRKQLHSHMADTFAGTF
ncbi:MAG: hypothetical protein RBS07_11930 [Lentimicrobium sp.]|jgi:hypothetical protein|nr:hypothetical protein [Lentimicrobium sp.]